MVTLFLRKFTHAVYELECLAKVGKRERLRDVVLFDNAPAIHLPLQGDEFLTLERRSSRNLLYIDRQEGPSVKTDAWSGWSSMSGGGIILILASSKKQRSNSKVPPCRSAYPRCRLRLAN